jgi:hypothetical protein
MQPHTTFQGMYAHLTVLEHVVEHRAVGLTSYAQIEALELVHEFVLIVRRDLLEEIQVLCIDTKRTSTKRD